MIGLRLIEAAQSSLLASYVDANHVILSFYTVHIVCCMFRLCIGGTTSTQPTSGDRQVKDYLDNLKTCLWWQNQVSQNMIFFLPGHLPETVAMWKTAAQDHSWQKKRYFSNRVCGNKTGHIFEHIGIICRPVSGNKTQRFWQDVKAISRHNQGKPSQLPRHLPETVDRWKTTVQDRSCQKPGIQFAAMIVASIPVIFYEK